MKLSKVLRVIGRGAAIAAEFTPAGAAVTKGLDIAGKALHQPESVEEEALETCREIAVQAVLANVGLIMAAAITEGRNKQSMIEDCTDVVEAWLKFEAEKAAAAEKAAQDGR